VEDYFESTAKIKRSSLTIRGASTFGRNIILVLQKPYYMVHLKKSIRQKWMLPTISVLAYVKIKYSGDHNALRRNELECGVSPYINSPTVSFIYGFLNF